MYWNRFGKIWYCDKQLQLRKFQFYELESIGTDVESFGTVIYNLESFGAKTWKLLEPLRSGKFCSVTYDLESVVTRKGKIKVRRRHMTRKVMEPT